jgi:hypothetical protein
VFSLGKAQYTFLGILNSKVINKEHQKVKSVTINRPWRGQLFTERELRHKGRVTPHSAGNGVCLSSWVAGRVTVNPSEPAVRGEAGVVTKFTKLESGNNEVPVHTQVL